MDSGPSRRDDAADPPPVEWREGVRELRQALREWRPRLRAWWRDVRDWRPRPQEWKRVFNDWKRSLRDWRQRPGPIVTLVTILAVTGVGGGAWALDDSESCSGRPLLFNVAAAPDIAPALQQVAARFNIQTHDVRGRCVQVEVLERTPVSMARRLSGHGARGDRFQAGAWVPDSSLWLTVARATEPGVKALSGEVSSIATSPVVLATPKRVAVGLQKGNAKPSWRMLLPEYAKLFGGRTSKAGVSVAMLDPINSSSGVAAVLAVRNVIGEHPRAPELLTTFVRNAQQSTSADPWGLFTYLTGLAAIGRPVVVASEQAVADYNVTHQRKPASALIPSEGTIVLDYPFVVTSQDPMLREAAEAFRWSLRSRFAQDTIQRAGFRTADGVPDQDVAREYGFNPQPPRRLPPPTPGQLNEALQAWNRLGLGSRILVLADVSGSMARIVPERGATRMKVAIDAALTGLELFPNDTDIGLWTFATDLNGTQDHRELIPLGPITERLGGFDRRRTLQRLAPSIKPRRSDETGLYDSILAGYRRVRNGWKPDKFNAVLVLTDGNNKGGQFSLNGLLDQLRKESDPQHPIQVIIVGFGADIEKGPLNKIAEATNGSTYSTKDPAQIINVFMEAIGRRLCTPNCPQR